MPDSSSQPEGLAEPQWGPVRTHRVGRTGPDSQSHTPSGRPGAESGAFPWAAEADGDRSDQTGQHDGGEQPRWGPPTQHRGHAAPPGRSRDASAMGAPGRSRQPPAGRPPSRQGAIPRRRLGVRRGRLIVVIVAVFLIGYPLALAATVMSSVTRVDALSAAGETGSSRGHVFLVVGSDTRAGANLNDDTPGQRADTIMLLNVPLLGPSTLVSIPRDSYVTIPGHGENKINAAYSLGGAGLLAQTVEESTGIRVDDYVETGLAGFSDVVDAVGGVELCPATDMNDKDAGLYVNAGCQQMDGATALAYARARHSDPRGDLGRVERQREVLSTIVRAAATPGVVLNPFSSFPLARAAGKALTVDESTSSIGLARFVLGMRSVTGDDALSLTVPISSAGLRTPQGVAVQWADSASSLFEAVASNDTDTIRSIRDGG